MTPNTERALQALDEAIPPHLRSNRHGEGFLGERYETLRAFILATLPSGIEADGDGGKGLRDERIAEIAESVQAPTWGDFQLKFARAIERELRALSPTSPPNGKTEGGIPSASEFLSTCGTAASKEWKEGWNELRQHLLDGTLGVNPSRRGGEQG